MPTSQKQIEANRNNAKNAGVKTERGKTIVRHNAFKHGLSAGALISDLDTYEETQKQYLKIVEGLKSTIKPRNYFEETQIEAMSKALLKTKRCDQLEAQQFTDGNGVFGKSGFRIDEEGTDFFLILKYKTSIENGFTKALETIKESRTWLNSVGDDTQQQST